MLQIDVRFGNPDAGALQIVVAPVARFVDIGALNIPLVLIAKVQLYRMQQKPASEHYHIAESATRGRFARHAHPCIAHEICQSRWPLRTVKFAGDAQLGLQLLTGVGALQMTMLMSGYRIWAHQKKSSAASTPKYMGAP